MTRRGRSRLIVAAAGAAPLALTLALAWLDAPPGPATVYADPLDEPAIAAPAAPVRTDRERVAAAYAAAQRDKPVGAAPFLYPQMSRSEPIAAAPPSQPVDPPPAVSVNTIMSGRGGAMATVNGKLRRLNDEVAPGWIIVAIDAAAGTVTVRHADGREIVAQRGR